MDKQVFDPRGRQANIARLFWFDKEAFVHMLFYRVLIALSIIAAVVFVMYYAFGLPAFAFESLFILVWVFFTPQVYETSKGISVIATKGFVHGYLNKSYMKSAEKYEKHGLAPLFRIMPYAALALWLAGLLTLSYLWFI